MMHILSQAKIGTQIGTQDTGFCNSEVHLQKHLAFDGCGQLGIPTASRTGLDR